MALNLTGFAPVTKTRINELIPPAYLSFTPQSADGIPAGSLTLTSYPPQAKQIKYELVPAASLTLTSYAPSDSSTSAINILVPSGSLTLTGVTPYPYQKHLIGDGYLTLTSYAPLVSVTGATLIDSTTLSLTSYAPQAGINKYELIGNTTLRLVSYAPTVTQGNITAIPSSNILLTGIAPNVKQIQKENIPSGNLRLVSFNPNKYQSGQIIHQVPSGNLRLVSYSPNIPRTARETRKAGGGPKRTFRKVVLIGGRRYKVESYTELRQLLLRFLNEQQRELSQIEPQQPKSKRVVTLKKNITRAETRLAKAEEAWQIERENEELLLMLVA